MFDYTLVTFSNQYCNDLIIHHECKKVRRMRRCFSTTIFVKTFNWM